MLSDRWSILSNNVFRRNNRILSLKRDLKNGVLYHAFGHRVVGNGEYFIWKIKVKQNAGQDMYIGIISDRVDTYDKSMRMESRWNYGPVSTGNGVMLNCSDRRLNGAEYGGFKQVVSFGMKDDIIEIILDRTRGDCLYLSYIINNIDRGVAYKGVHPGHSYQLALVVCFSPGNGPNGSWKGLSKRMKKAQGERMEIEIL